MGPLNHSWYLILDRAILGHGLRIVGKKVLADQLVMAPVCCSVFYVGESKVCKQIAHCISIGIVAGIMIYL